MKKIYQTEWQGIQFSDFVDLSSSNLRRAGYRDIEDGFIEPEKGSHYWISGH